MSNSGRENYDPQSLEASQSQRSGLTPYGNGAQTPVRSGSAERGSGSLGSISRTTSSFFMTATTANLAKEADRKRRKLEGHGQQLNNGDRRGSAEGGGNPKGMGRPRSMSHDHRPRSWARDVAWFVLRTVALGMIGVAYGVLVTQLQDKKVVAPVKVEGIDMASRWYLLFWGVSSVILGNALPYVDELMGGQSEQELAGGRRKGEEKEDFLLRQSETSNVKREQNTRTSLGADWNPAVRSIGAFVGIAFAIVSLSSIMLHKRITNPSQRRLPWQSTLQLSLTLALANPCIWYLIDRTRAGFLLSSFVGIVGAAVLLIVHPAVLPQPARRSNTAEAHLRGNKSSTIGNTATMLQDLPLGLSKLGLTYENIGVATWAASVLFCSAVCFGNIGRKLARGLR